MSPLPVKVYGTTQIKLKPNDLCVCESPQRDQSEGSPYYTTKDGGALYNCVCGKVIVEKPQRNFDLT
jgi:hypothetical protein